MREGAIVHLSDLLGRQVIADGQRLGRLRDLSVRLDELYPRIVRLLVGRDSRSLPWNTVTEFGPVVRVSDVGRGDADVVGELLLRRDVLDCQIFDFAGKRLTRVSDVELAFDGTTLRIVAVDVGACALLRRLGLGSIARHVPSKALDWQAIHLASARGHALQLDQPNARVHQLSAEEVARLVSRVPATQGDEVLRSLDREKAEKTRRTLAERHPSRRRFRNVLSARKRAPA